MNKYTKTTVVGLLAATMLAGITPLKHDDAFGGKGELAQSHRKYLAERKLYMETNKEALGIPQTSVDKAVYAQNTFENYLLKKRYINKKGGNIHNPSSTLLGSIVSNFPVINRVQAYTFGIEDFETCVSIPCTFTSEDSYGTGAFALDATSKVNGTDSARCDISTAGDGCILAKTLTSGSVYYIQMQVFFPTGWSFGPNGYLTLFDVGDGTGNPVYCNVEDYGTLRITCAGDELGYTNTGLDISLNTITRLEFKITISSSAGDVDIWLNNTTESSPSYDGSGTLNTGTQNITKFNIGGYSPDVVGDKYYDDVIADTSFIGLGSQNDFSPQLIINNGAVATNNGVLIID